MYPLAITKLLTILLLCCTACLNALPSGAPKCAINHTVISNGHSAPPSPSLGFGLQVATSSATMAPGNNLTIKLTNSDPSITSFKGVLMFFQGTTNPKKRFGKFVAFNDANIKPQTAVCTRDGFTGDDAAVITHSNPSDKPFSAHTFVWTPLPGDESEVMLTLRAVVVGQSNKQWMEVAPIAVKFS